MNSMEIGASQEAYGEANFSVRLSVSIHTTAFMHTNISTLIYPNASLSTYPSPYSTATTTWHLSPNSSWLISNMMHSHLDIIWTPLQWTINYLIA